MSLLCSLDYPRAVIIKGVQLRDKWYRVIFHHSEPQLAVQHLTSFAPLAREVYRTHRCLVDYQDRAPLQARCTLTNDFDVKDLDALFHSGLDVLCTDLSVPELSPELRAELEQWPIRPLKRIQDLDHYDRLLIFMDGSSRPSMRRVRWDPDGAAYTGINRLGSDMAERCGDCHAITPFQPVCVQIQQCALVRRVERLARPIQMNLSAS